MWGQAGFNMAVQEEVAQAELILNLAAGKFQGLADEGFSAPDPDLNYVWLSPTTAGTPGGVALNFARNRDPAIETSLQQGRTNPEIERHALRPTNASTSSWPRTSPSS